LLNPKKEGLQLSTSLPFDPIDKENPIEMVILMHPIARRISIAVFMELISFQISRFKIDLKGTRNG
jgi:hypothetical protein